MGAHSDRMSDRPLTAWNRIKTVGAHLPTLGTHAGDPISLCSKSCTTRLERLHRHGPTCDRYGHRHSRRKPTDMEPICHPDLQSGSCLHRISHPWDVGMLSDRLAGGTRRGTKSGRHVDGWEPSGRLGTESNRMKTESTAKRNRIEPNQPALAAVRRKA